MRRGPLTLLALALGACARPAGSAEERAGAAPAGPRPAVERAAPAASAGPDLAAARLGLPAALPPGTPTELPAGFDPSAACARLRASMGERGADVVLPGDVDVPEHPRDTVLRYPDVPRGTRGRVHFLYVIDTTGAIEPGSVRVVAAANADVYRGGLDLLGRTSYRPAAHGGRPVRICVHSPTVFQERAGG